jgi:hypothetical protein
MTIDKQRVAAVAALEALGHLFPRARLAPTLPSSSCVHAEADAMHALLVTRADQLMACLEESEGAIEAFVGIADDIADVKQTMATKDE